MNIQASPKPKRIRGIVTHEKPHLDEIFAIWLLRTFGEEQFPGVSKAKVNYWTSGGTSPDGLSAEQYLQDGIILVGVGGGCFDEHSTSATARKEGECTATLVAKALGIDEDPALDKLLRFVVQEDLKGSTSAFNLASMVKVMHQHYDPKKVFEWTVLAIEAKYLEQLQFWTTTRGEFMRISRVEEIQGPGDRGVVVVSFKSDDPLMNKFARSSHGANAAVVVQKNSSGNVQVFTNKRFGLKLFDVARMLRLEEQRLKGGILQTTDAMELTKEGVVPGCEEWYFHHEMQSIMNGSLTAKDVPRTRLSFERIVEIVHIGINPAAFEPKRAARCEQGFCDSCPQNRCPWEPYGLTRCHKIRIAEKREK